MTERATHDIHIDSASSKNDLSLEMSVTKTSCETNSLLKEKELDNSIPVNDIEKDITLTRRKVIPRRRSTENYPQKILPYSKGNMLLYYYKNGNPRVCIGPHWPFTLCMICFITIACFIYFFFLWSRLNVYVKILGIIIYLLQMSSFIYTALANPGLPSSEMFIDNMNEIKVKNYRLCYICHVIMQLEEETEHCEECNVCIEGHDHHCPWASKCIGRGNIFSFYFFVIFSLILMGFLVFGVFTLLEI